MRYNKILVKLPGILFKREQTQLTHYFPFAMALLPLFFLPTWNADMMSGIAGAMLQPWRQQPENMDGRLEIHEVPRSSMASLSYYSSSGSSLLDFLLPEKNTLFTAELSNQWTYSISSTFWAARWGPRLLDPPSHSYLAPNSLPPTLSGQIFLYVCYYKKVRQLYLIDLRLLLCPICPLTMQSSPQFDHIDEA